MNRRAGIRDQILDAAADILESKGLRHLNTNAMAAAAQVTPPTVYRYFQNKEAAVAALADRFVDAERTWLEHAMVDLSSGATLYDKIGRLIDAYWSAAQKQRGIVALRGAMRVWPELRAAEESSLAHSTVLVAELLGVHSEQCEPQELARVARYVVETVCSTVDRCYALPKSERRWRIEELKRSVGSYVHARLDRA